MTLLQLLSLHSLPPQRTKGLHREDHDNQEYCVFILKVNIGINIQTTTDIQCLLFAANMNENNICLALR